MSTNTVSLSKSVEEKSAKPLFYVISIRKLIYMTLLTTGLYAFYWFYRNWATYRSATGDDVSPVLRSILPVFFVFPLLRRVDQSLEHSRSQYDWSPRLLGVAMWLIMVVSVGSGLLTPLPIGDLKHDALINLRGMIEVILQLVASLWVMCRIQLAINVVECDPRGESNSRSTRANNGWMMLGVTLWMFFFIVFAMNLSIAFR